ncbi:MAG: zf-HC2 domain-containing protein [Acidobacteria bacterium]|nr:zf-HC2 domain-containing protein [Acidobacteriota bacterium]
MNINCEICRNELEDYLDGESDQATSVALRAHLESCAACASVQGEIERENAIYSGFYEETEIEPSPASWIAVRDRIREERGQSAGFSVVAGDRKGSFLAGLLTLLTWIARPVVLQQAAFAIALIVLSVAMTLYFVRQQGTSAPGENSLAVEQKTVRTPVTPEPSPSPERFESVAVDGKTAPQTARAEHKRINRPVKAVSESDLLATQVARAEREYLNAIKLLDRAIARRRDQMDPFVMKQYEASLALIDQSIESSRNAYRQNRNDLNASQFLISAYSRKVELMQDIAMR